MSKLKSTARLSNRLSLLAIAILALFALGLRLARLGERPFHCDEAVQASKFGQLLDDGFYRYDPIEHHGPTLYYLSLPLMWLCDAESIDEVDEARMRTVPALFGAGLILLLFLARDGLGKGAILAAAGLTALSPFMLFYSRYYIQETILIFFTLGAILSAWRYYRSQRPGWIVAAGACIGLMYATKETCIISWASLGIAYLLTAGRRSLAIFRIHPLHAAFGVISAVALAAIFFSSFGAHPAGIFESVEAYANYFTRASGEGHAHPWYNYLKLIFWHREQGILWSELLIGVLAVAGMIACHAGTRDDADKLPRFLAYYTLAMLAIYSLIPYKTPWLALGFLQPAIMLAGFGAARILRIDSTVLKCGLAAVMLAAFMQLGRQAWLSSFRYYADERNPCVYSHTSTDAVRAARQIREIARLSSDGKSTAIKVIADEYWPLPWYLRDFEHVGYWHDLPDNPRAPIIIASRTNYAALSDSLKNDYFTTLAGLRPGVLLQILIRRDLWDRYLETMRQ